MTEKTKIPEIRFGSFDGDWETYKLGDAMTSYSGGTPLVGKKEYYDGKIPFIRSAEINSDKTELFISEDGLNNSSAKMVNIGDILYALYGATSGEVGIARIQGAINQAILAIKPEDDYDSQFIMQWLRNQKQKIINKYLQGGQGNLSGSIVKDLKISLPKFEEQAQIGNFFKQLDNLISLHQRKYEKTVNIKKAMLEKMFPKKGEDKPEVRFSGFTDKWIGHELGGLGKVYTGNTPPTYDKKNWTKDKNGYVWITPTDINSLVMSDSERYLTNIGWQKARRVPKNSVLITSIASIGKNTINTIPVAFNQQINAIVPENNDSYFILSAMEKEIKRFASLAGQTATAIINKTEFKKFFLLMPNIEEQIQIGTFFKQLDKLIALQQNELEKLKNIKKACLEKMFV